MRVLARHGVLTSGTGDALHRAVGFRNVLVHEYVAVDDAVVLRRLGDLDDLRAFVAELGVWVQSR